MPRTCNALGIMCDQLRFDYLGCAGHPSLRTAEANGGEPQARSTLPAGS